MPDLARIRAHGRALWDEIRSDARPVVAPYPERAPLHPWKWDRPVDLMLGRIKLIPTGRQHPYQRRAEAILERAEALRGLDDSEIDARCRDIRQRLMRRGLADGLVDECLALIREVTGRELGLRHFAVQLIGGLIMLDGGFAEMATGEGKTITALLPAVTAAMARLPVHVFTVNDYLAQRDAEYLAPVYRRFGLEVGLVIHGQETPERRAAYNCPVVYGTNKEITFDYLRDQTALGQNRGATRRLMTELFGAGAHEPLIMRGLFFAVVDEADSIFIDEARTPLILSAESPADDDGLHLAALELAQQLETGRHYHIREADKAIELTDRGRRVVAELSQGLPHNRWRIRQAREDLVTKALAAHWLYKRDRDYILADDKVQIVDESTGRVMADRSWEGGLQQLIEAKEQVQLSGTRNTMARITYQRFFRRYLRLAGMSGTAREMAPELWADYGLAVKVVPRNRPSQRQDRGHMLFQDAGRKWAAVAQSVLTIRQDEAMRPILVGTRSVADSEAVAAALEAVGISVRILNARQDAEEAEIIAMAGQVGAVTVATNMAGRGTDILLSDEALAAGGLHVILTAFHETPRIDRQLEGRAGRQGDPGSSQAITAIDDELYTLFAPQLTKTMAASTTVWPVEGRSAKMLRRWAQAAAERRHAAARRQTELAEERLQQSMAFSGRS